MLMTIIVEKRIGFFERTETRLKMVSGNSAHEVKKNDIFKINVSQPRTRKSNATNIG